MQLLAIKGPTYMLLGHFDPGKPALETIKASNNCVHHYPNGFLQIMGYEPSKIFLHI